ncbi:dihydropteroate synthase [bacterium]|nr:dihydropteroate synthase [bacterium]
MSIYAPQIMGIINTTPDSFYKGSRVSAADECVKQALFMKNSGASWIDIGGESTRPGAVAISSDEEMSRVLPALEAICKNVDIKISVDTRRSAVAREAVSLGASMINDVSGFEFDDAMASVVAKTGVLGVVMHSRGTPDTMQHQIAYDNFIDDTIKELETRIAKAASKGVKKEQIIVDPGFGFAKAYEHNLLLVKNLNQFNAMGFPLMIGVSRKNFIGRLMGEENPENRLNGSLAVTAYMLRDKPMYIRTHDVKETAALCKIYATLEGELL